MTTNSFIQLRHRCGTCSALLGSLDDLREHASLQHVRSAWPPETDSQVSGPHALPENDSEWSMRERPLDMAPKPRRHI